LIINIKINIKVKHKEYDVIEYSIVLRKNMSHLL